MVEKLRFPVIWPLFLSEVKCIIKVASNCRKILSIQCQTFGNYELSSKQRYLTEIGQYDSRMQIITLINFSEYNLSISSLS